jgi:hypothetical protein
VKPFINTWRAIGWNGLTLSCPKKWEAIVSGKRHLLFEEDFTPIFELRWQNNDSNKKSSDSILRRLQKETNLYRQGEISTAWRQLEKVYEIIPLAAEESNEQKGALLTCRHCGTSLLLYFFHAHAMQNPDLQQVISSLSCHDLKGKDTLWAIQDFRILLPHRYQFSGYSFAAGLTRLTFLNSGLTMHLCRLAQASRRLQTTPLSDLMVLLSGFPVPKEEITHQAQSVYHSNQPSIFRQILMRLKHKPPFHRMILRHHPEYDRLSGLFFEDKKPIPEDQANSILSSYEIFPL